MKIISHSWSPAVITTNPEYSFADDARAAAASLIAAMCYSSDGVSCKINLTVDGKAVETYLRGFSASPSEFTTMVLCANSAQDNADDFFVARFGPKGWTIDQAVYSFAFGDLPENADVYEVQFLGIAPWVL